MNPTRPDSGRRLTVILENVLNAGPQQRQWLIDSEVEIRELLSRKSPELSNHLLLLRLLSRDFCDEPKLQEVVKGWRDWLYRETDTLKAIPGGRYQREVYPIKVKNVYRDTVQFI